MLHSIIFEGVEIREENRDHAVANAAQAAQLLEDDRRATRREELIADLWRQRRKAASDIERIDAALDALRAPHVTGETK